ncbi:MAG: ChrR family anti-sigma-E factor [Pseudomonadota bacterium]
MVMHLPPEEMLADFASGATPPAVSLLVAAHLTQSPESRAQVQAYEDAGGVLLQDETPIEVAQDSFDAVMAMIDEVPQDPANVDSEPEVEADCPLPRPVLDAIGMKFDEIPWKFRLPGVSVYDLEAFGDQRVSLMRARPGASVPQHTHKGTELTLVMQGVMLDDGIEYGAGDVAVNTEDDDHRPKILGDEICYCLIVQQGDLHFTGRFSRILNYIGE